MSDDRNGFQLSPSLDDLAALAEAAFADLPKGVRDMAGDVVFRVDDFPSSEVLAETGIEDPFELTGLYQGVPFGQKSVFDPSPELARIFLYRRPLLDEWVERGDVTLPDLVSHVLVHEIGHHFGLTDDDIDALEAAADSQGAA